jgi:Flp pilus assembly protein TadB
MGRPACDHGRMPSTQRDALPERVVRGGGRVVVTVTRRAIDQTRATSGTPLQRLGVALVLVPALVLMLVLAAILFVVLLVAAAFLAAALALTTFVVRRRLPRAR